MFFEDAFIYFPTKHPEGRWDPKRLGLGVEDVHFAASDRTELHGWFVAAEAPVATLLFCHGNAGNITDRAEIAAAMREVGFSVFLFDYRGYGKSEGKPSEEGLYLDGEAAFDWLARQDDVDRGRIVLFGESLGGAVAAELALRRKAGALVLQSTFTSAREMARRVLPIFPVGPFLRHDYDTLGKAPRIRVPLLVVHGDRDSMIPFEMGRRIYEAANDPKRFHPVERADHNDLYDVGGMSYMRELRRFVEEHLGPATEE
ncbi:MAG: alpha/beta hydrolase [Planctomycetes bacterium]|nr:alpha/beta hydrolase [Planctomycetota bacterium]